MVLIREHCCLRYNQKGWEESTSRLTDYDTWDFPIETNSNQFPINSQNPLPFYCDSFVIEIVCSIPISPGVAIVKSSCVRMNLHYWHRCLHHNLFKCILCFFDDLICVSHCTSALIEVECITELFCFCSKYASIGCYFSVYFQSKGQIIVKMYDKSIYTLRKNDALVLRPILAECCNPSNVILAYSCSNSISNHP